MSASPWIPFECICRLQPKLSAESKNARLVFLGNIQPDLQRGVREQIPNAELVALDTMNLWIDTARDSLISTIKGVDVVIINDAEARQIDGDTQSHQGGPNNTFVGS